MKNRSSFKPYLKPILIGIILGLVSLGLESVEDIRINPFPIWQQPYLQWLMSHDGPTYHAYMHLKNDYSVLQSQAVGLRFCMLFLDHGFLYVILPSLACVLMEQFRKVRAIDCIRKSLILLAITILTFATAGIFLLGVLGELPLEQSFDQMFIYLLRGLKVLVAFLTVSGILLVFLVTSLCVYMAYWKPTEKC